MRQLEITLSSGAQTRVDVESFEIDRSKITQQVVKFNWVTPEGAIRRLALCNLSDIVMVVEINWPDPPSPWIFYPDPAESCKCSDEDHQKHHRSERPMDEEGMTYHPEVVSGTAGLDVTTPASSPADHLLDPDDPCRRAGRHIAPCPDESR